MFPKIMGTPKSSILIGFSIIFTVHFGGNTPIFGSTHMRWSWDFGNKFRQVVRSSLSFLFTVRPCGRHDARRRGRPGTSSSGRGALRGREKQRSFGVQL